jgi:hypothetical protein
VNVVQFDDQVKIVPGLFKTPAEVARPACAEACLASLERGTRFRPPGLLFPSSNFLQIRLYLMPPLGLLDSKPQHSGD